MTAISPNFIIQCQLRFKSTSNSIFKRAIGISTNSTEEVGRIYLDALKQHAPEFRPTAYLGDAAEAFANAALGVFDTITTRLMCFAHVYKVGEVLEYYDRRIKCPLQGRFYELSQGGYTHLSSKGKKF